MSLGEFEKRVIDLARKLQPEFEAKFPQLRNHDVRAARSACQPMVMQVYCTATAGNSVNLTTSFAFDRDDQAHADDADKLREEFIKRKDHALLDLEIFLNDKVTT